MSEKSSLLLSDCDCGSGVFQSGTDFLCSRCGAPLVVNTAHLLSTITQLQSDRNEMQLRLMVVEDLLLSVVKRK